MKINHDDGKLTVYLAGRIDANHAAEIESEISAGLAKFPGEIPTFDASELEYISSAGLRVLLKFRKKFAKSLDVIDVSNDVYDIFSVTGFTELLNVRKKLREISIEGCPVIGGGLSSTVYRLDAETIVKVFDKNAATLAAVEHDRNISREVFLHDIPTAIAYDVVRVGEHFGLVYEMIDADTVAKTISKHPERLEELSIKMAHLLKKLHTTEFDTGTFPKMKDILRSFMELPFSKGIITAEDKEAICGLIDRIPDRKTFVHLDYHPNNVMLADDKLVIIDVGDSGLGHPMIDLLSSYSHCMFLPKFLEQVDNGAHAHHMGINAQTLAAMWNIMLPEYFGTTDKETLKGYEEVIIDYLPLTVLPGLCLGPISDEKRAQLAAPIVERFRKVIPTLHPIESI